MVWCFFGRDADRVRFVKAIIFLLETDSRHIVIRFCFTAGAFHLHTKYFWVAIIQMQFHGKESISFLMIMSHRTLSEN